MEDNILYNKNPAMFRNRPLLFILCLAAIAAYGAGLLILIIWYIRVKAVRLKITNKRIEVKRGILRKNTTEIHMSDVRNIRTNQSFFQRIFGVGKIIISSAATGGVEIKVKGIKGPEKVKKMIRENRKI